MEIVNVVILNQNVNEENKILIESVARKKESVIVNRENRILSESERNLMICLNLDCGFRGSSFHEDLGFDFGLFLFSSSRPFESKEKKKEKQKTKKKTRKTSNFLGF